MGYRTLQTRRAVLIGSTGRQQPLELRAVKGAPHQPQFLRVQTRAYQWRPALHHGLVADEDAARPELELLDVTVCHIESRA